MDNTKNDRYFIKKLREDLFFIVRHMKDVSLEELTQNEILLDSMMFRLITVIDVSVHMSKDLAHRG